METLILFGDWLEKRRKAMDMTRKDLAERVNCSVSALRKIEANERRPSKQLAELLATAICIPEEEQEEFIRLARWDSSIEIKEAAPALPSLEQLQPVQKPPHNLPIPPTALVDRKEELAAICDMLADPQCRLISLVGLGGVGKTRIAIEAASLQHTAFADGVFFVALAPLNSPNFITPAIANVLGFTFSSYADQTTQLLDFLQNKQLLLVLDNFEQLLEGTNIILQILESAPEVKLLLTSREQLNLRGEWVFEIQGLSIPAADELEAPANSGAVSLFVETARRTNVTFTLTDQNQRYVAQICRLVGGIPLAIELAASWEQTLSCREIAQEVERNLDFLAAPMRGVPDRHRSMRAAFDYSWSMLSDKERDVLMRLSVFRGGFNRVLAEQVAGATPALLSALIMKSLIRRVNEERYDMHEVVRQYGSIQLKQANLAEQVCHTHLEAFVQLAETAESSVQDTWLQRLDQEQDNLRAALVWSKNLPTGDETGLRLAAELWPYWDIRGNFTEGRQWLQGILARAPHRTFTRAKALKAAGGLAWGQGDFATANSLLSESLAIFQELGNQRDIAAGLLNVGILTYSQGDYASANPLFQQSLEIFRQLDHKLGISNVLNSLGVWASDQGEYSLAREYFTESLAIRREIGFKRGIAISIGNLGLTALRQGEYPAARTLLQESLEGYQEIGDKRGMGNTLNELGRVALKMGELDLANSLFQESLGIFQGTGSQEGATTFLEGSARLAYSKDDYERAARLLAAAEVLRERTGIPLPPVDRMEKARILDKVREALGESRWAALWAEGRKMTVEQATGCALDNG